MGDKMARAIRIGGVVLACGLAAIIFMFFYRTNKSEVLISDQMREFVDTVDLSSVDREKKLIIFDLDDTVFMSSQLVGTPTWFYNLINLVRQSGAAKYEAYAVVSRIDRIVQEKIQVVAVEQATLSAIRTWQKLGATVIGLSSRPADLSHITKMQLRQIGLEFSSPYFSCVSKEWQEPGGAFIDGVIYVDDHLTKVEVFGHFYDRLMDCGMDVDLIAHADDQQRYVSEIAAIAKKKRVDFVGIIYGGALSSRTFDLQRANRQLLELEAALSEPIIPDEYRPIFNP